jgi:hypothetical protein
VFGGACVLNTVTINKTDATHTLTLQEGPTNGVANAIGIIKANILEQALFYQAACPAGLQVIVPSGYAGDVTVTYDPL